MGKSAVFGVSVICFVGVMYSVMYSVNIYIKCHLVTGPVGMTTTGSARIEGGTDIELDRLQGVHLLILVDGIRDFLVRQARKGGRKESTGQERQRGEMYCLSNFPLCSKHKHPDEYRVWL